MIQEAALNENLRVATVERIARYTVGIGVDHNRWMGTGTLIASGTDRYILTACHVVAGAQLSEMRFSCKPPAPIIEKAAKDVTDAEIGVGNFTMGYSFPILNVVEDRDADIALLKIDPAFVLPGAAEYYDIDKSREFKSWPVQALEGLSLFLYGFPVDNSRPLYTEGSKTFYFLGTASYTASYSSKINRDNWKHLSKRVVSPERDFLVDYAPPEGIGPKGFSGAGVWVITADKNRLVWGSDPVLIGMAFRSFDRPALIAAAKLPTILEVLKQA